MEEIISKREIDELKKIKGQIRGIGLKDILEFILKEEGKEGVKKLEDAATSLGYSIKHKNIKGMNFYPLVFLATLFLLIKKIFNYDDEKFQEMGRFCSRTSVIIRLFMKYLVSIETVAKEAPIMYKKYFTTGSLEVVEYDKERKYAVGRIENLRIHPTHCQYLMGYFSSLIEMVTKKVVVCEEIKCIYSGDKYHEFLVKW